MVSMLLCLLMVATVSPADLQLQRYTDAAAEAGCPWDQVENFLRAGIVLQPKQLAACAAARLCDDGDGPTEIGYGGARGGGKSFWGIAQLGADDCQRFPGLTCLILRKVGKANRENFDNLRRKLFSNLPHVYRRQEGMVEFPNGSRIITGHFQHEGDIDAYLGLEYDVILTEEATTLTKSKRDDISTCNRSSKPGWRPREYSTANPGGVGHAHYKARFVEPYRKGRQADTRFIPATVDDNAHNNPEYKRKLERLTGWKLRAWRYGDWDIAAGQFFTTFRRDVEGVPHHVIPRLELPHHWRVWLGFDYGFTHYTAVYLMAADDDGNVYVVDEHAERGWLPERHVAAILAMLGRNNVEVGRLKTIAAGLDVFNKDRRGTSIAEDYASHGLRLKPADVDRINGAAEILKRLGDVEAGIKATLFVTENCPRLIECLPSLEHDPHRPEDVLKVDTDEDGNGGDDFYDAARYGLMVVKARRSGSSTNGSALLQPHRG
jgi:phage terminase large subunit